jgi:carbamate kinase
MRTVVALGGNAIAGDGETAVASQRERIRETAESVARLTDRGHEVVLTHGNGPQVGALLLQQEEASAPERPLDVLVAETQAQIGSLLVGELHDRIDGRAVTVVTRVRVDPDDPAFDDPAKPVGPYYDEAEAAEKEFETGPVTTPAGDRAYRRLVPSPRPRAVLEAAQIRALVDRGATVVCGGGGGVPVAGDGETRGVAAVVDKDRTTSLVAAAVDADCVAMATDVEYAYRDFGTPDQRPIEETDAASMRAALDADEFADGSMRPKVEACLDFLDRGGRRAVITTPADVPAALDGDTGTRIHP